MAHLTRPAEISGVSAGIFPETAAGNRACLLFGKAENQDYKTHRLSFQFFIQESAN